MVKKTRILALSSAIAAFHLLPVNAGAIEDEAIKITNSISGPLYVWLQNSFDLGDGGSTRQVSSLQSWKMQQVLFQQGSAARNIYQEEALRIAREAEERGTARCDRMIASGGGLCMQLTNTANQHGWHAVFDLTTNADLIDHADSHIGFASYNFGPIDTVRVLDTRSSIDNRCDVWVKYRVWPIQEKMTIVGTAFMEANRIESIDQEVCYRLGRDGLNSQFTNLVTD